MRQRAPLGLLLFLLVFGNAVATACADGRKQPRKARSAQAVAPVAREAIGYLQRKMDWLTARTGPGDALYVDNGIWHVGTDACNRCPLGGAVSAAVLAAYGAEDQRARYRAIARQTVDRVLATQRPDGAFPSLTDPSKPDGIENEFDTVEIGTVHRLIGDELSAATRTRWLGAMRRSANYMISSGMTTWYANGNINLGVTVALGLVARATGDDALRAAYEASWRFTLHPPVRWAAFGVRFAKTPRQASWADGAGFLVENGQVAGFDAHYAQLQASIATRAWLVLGDARAFRLANALTNVLLPRVDAAGELDTGGGSRHPVEGLRFPFITAAPAAVGACRGGLPDPTRQFGEVADWFDRNLDAGSPQNNNAWLMYMGLDVASFAMLAGAPACPSAATLATAARASKAR